MATWPTGLPQAPSPSGYINNEKNSLIRSQMGYGPDKVRQRVTMVTREVTMQFFLDNTDADTLDAFYVTTLKRTLSFDWIDHRTGNAAVYRFVAPPVFTAYGSALWWDVTLKLEIIG